MRIAALAPLAGLACAAAYAFYELGRAHSSPAAALLSDAGATGATGRIYRARRVRAYTGGLEFQEGAPRVQALAPPHNTSCMKWCVFTTINAPTKPVHQCAGMRGWCAVVVGDKKSPRSYAVPKHVVYLDPAAQRALPYRIVSLLRWNHFGRKNIGYVYAIHHGARVILDIDDDNELLPSAVQQGSLGSRVALLGHRLGGPTSAAALLRHVPSGRALYNPYPHFRLGEDNASSEEMARHPAWPRGFPLESLLDSATRPPLRAAPSPDAAATAAAAWPRARAPLLGAIQLLADHDPDVDALYRLSRRLPQTFGERADLVALAAGTMAPFNAQALLVGRPAFWGLLLPVSVHGRVSDIWRSYAWQRLMWQIGQGVAFSAPLIKQVRNPHSYLADLNAELPLYERAGELVALLRRLPLRAARLPGQAEELAVALYEHGILELTDVRLTQAFLADLMAVGYEFPTSLKVVDSVKLAVPVARA